MIRELGMNLIPVLAISCTFLFLMIWVVCATVASMFKTFCDSRLKNKLIERGSSAHEIAQIINAGSESDESENLVTPVPPIKSPRQHTMAG